MFKEFRGVCKVTKHSRTGWRWKKIEKLYRVAIQPAKLDYVQIAAGGEIRSAGDASAERIPSKPCARCYQATHRIRLSLLNYARGCGIKDRSDGSEASQVIDGAARRGLPTNYRTRRYFEVVLKAYRRTSRVPACFFSCCRDRTSQNSSLDPAESFVVPEKEKLVAAIIEMGDCNRAACGKSKLVLPQFALLDAACIFKEVRRV